MKQKREQKITVEIDVCDICKKDITNRPSSTTNRFRLPMINGLLKITTFDAHDHCVNRIIREAFKKYV